MLLFTNQTNAEVAETKTVRNFQNFTVKELTLKKFFFNFSRVATLFLNIEPRYWEFLKFEERSGRI